MSRIASIILSFTFIVHLPACLSPQITQPNSHDLEGISLAAQTNENGTTCWSVVPLRNDQSFLVAILSIPQPIATQLVYEVDASSPNAAPLLKLDQLPMLEFGVPNEENQLVPFGKRVFFRPDSNEENTHQYIAWLSEIPLIPPSLRVVGLPDDQGNVINVGAIQDFAEDLHEPGPWINNVPSYTLRIGVTGGDITSVDFSTDDLLHGIGTEYELSSLLLEDGADDWGSFLCIANSEINGNTAIQLLESLQAVLDLERGRQCADYAHGEYSIQDATCVCENGDTIDGFADRCDCSGVTDIQARVRCLEDQFFVCRRDCELSGDAGSCEESCSQEFTRSCRFKEWYQINYRSFDHAYSQNGCTCVNGTWEPVDTCTNQ